MNLTFDADRDWLSSASSDPEEASTPRLGRKAQALVDSQVDVAPLSRTAALEAVSQIGPVLYACTFGPMIKIGWSAHLDRRMMVLRADAARRGFRRCEMLAFRFGDAADEAEVHRTLSGHAAEGREYYHRSPEVMGVINEWRTPLGLPDIEA